MTGEIEMVKVQPLGMLNGRETKNDTLNWAELQASKMTKSLHMREFERQMASGGM